MPEEDKTQSHPLVEFVQAATERRGDSGDKGGSSLVTYLVLAGMAVLGFSIMGWMLVRARRKAALMAARLRLLEEEKIRAEEDAKLADNEESRFVASVRINAATDEIKELKDHLEGLVEQNRIRSEALASITDWDSLVVVDKRAKGD